MRDGPDRAEISNANAWVWGGGRGGIWAEVDWLRCQCKYKGEIALLETELVVGPW